MTPDVNPSPPTFLGATEDVPPTLPTPTANDESRQVTIRLKALDGTWETCGVDRMPSVVPESVVLDADDWGSKGARFDLKRDPSQVWPDIGAFTPVKIDVDGSPSWSGRVSETPSRDGTDMVMSVACEGWQHHLDDDMFEGFWVHNRASDWKDRRTVGLAPLGATGYFAAGSIQSDNGVVLSIVGGAAVSIGSRVGVVLDLGPSQTPDRVSITYETSNNNNGTPQVQFTASATSDLSTDGTTAYGPSALTTMGAGPSTTSFTLTGGDRYIILRLNVALGAGTTTGDAWVRLSNIKVYSQVAYESGNASALKASTVISDVLDRACPLLSSDRSGITATSFNIPALAPSDPLTARDYAQAVNAYHGWMAKVDVDGRFVFQAVPSRPKYCIGEWSAAEITDSSQNSGQDIFNKVIVTGTDPAGQPVRVVRTAAQIAPSTFFISTNAPTLANPSFDTNTTGWSSTGSPAFTLTRDTTGGNWDTTPAALKCDATAAGSSVPATVAAATTGTFRAGFTYRIRFWAKVTASQSVALSVAVGSTTSGEQVVTGSSTQYMAFSFTPTANVTNPTLTIYMHGYGSSKVPDSALMWLDTFTIDQAAPTLPDRRSFVRAKQLAVNSVLPSDGVAAAAIGDVWLQNHITTPFRGSVVLTGEDALRNRLTGQPVPLAALLRDTGELLELTDRPDPDTGATTRKGRITTVSYVPALDQATVALDSTRANLDNLLNRLAATG